MKNKIISAADAAALIRDGDTVTTSGFVGIGVPEALLMALEKRFVETSAPHGLTLLFAAGQGDGKDKGLNHLGHEGLLARVVGGHWGLIPKIGRLAVEGLIEAYNLPQGVISHLYRDIAAGKPGTLTHVGLGTFVDPRLEGGKINDVTHEDLVSVMEIAGKEHLFYRAMPIQVALLRGTTADPAGNITMEREALVIDNLAQAMAARNSGGVVIVQVERIAARGALNPRQVQIPAALVDAVVVAEPGNHMQTFATPYSHLFAGQFRAPADVAAPMQLDARKIIARRAAFELPVNGVVNLGIGMPEGVAAVAAEEGLLDHVTLTAEPGVMGGQPASGLDFGAATNTDAIIPQHQQFDFYDGGGLDLAVLGMAEADKTGNVNVSRFGPRLAGAGGFINISQNARHVVFTGTFTAGGMSLKLEDGKVRIAQEGRSKKLMRRVQQVTFSGARAVAERTPVLFVTERCVFELTSEGLRLSEVAPGIDIEADILDHMDFHPIIDTPDLMDARIFGEDPMGLRVDLLHLDMSDRIVLDGQGQRLFINFEKLRIRTPDDVAQVKTRVEALLEGHPNRVDVIVNYDGSRIDDEIAADYAAMVADLDERFYARVTRYSSSAFMRMKLGKALDRALNRAPYIFETAEDAQHFLEGEG
ncbi:MAG: acyl CoA:acetate/3-ketoacid CoA transferase [Hyphomicrobiales bacterium]